MIAFIIYLLGVIATAILLIFIVVKEDDEITLLALFLGIITSLASWFGFMFISLIEYGEVVIYKREKNNYESKQSTREDLFRGNIPR